MNEKWILCKDRQPTSKKVWYGADTEYLVCTKNGTILLLYYCDGWNCSFVSEDMDVNRNNEIKDVIAWMPLPDPISEEVE